MFSPSIKRNIYRILPFGVLWLIFGLIYLIIEKGILGDFDHYPSTGNPYDFEGTAIFSVITAAVSGLILGAIEILFLEDRFKKRSLGQKITFKTLIYIVMMVVFLSAISLIDQSFELDVSIFDPRAWANVKTFIFSFAFLSLSVYISLLIGVSLFYSEVSQNLGLSVLYNFFAGKYHRPIVEDRIFMFLDMKSSTAIAEKLGHVKYFEMLREYYSDLSDPIVAFRGEIYQYVGDEVIISWKPKYGLENDNCFQCFFAMKDALEAKAKKYLQKYEVIPTFKAGLHYGQVTTGEIGVVKKDIIFTGDVLNTTARIQGLCNEHHTNFLVSADLIKRMNPDSPFHVKSIGTKDLRGRNEPMELFAVQYNG